jgi:hypothetical protein
VPFFLLVIEPVAVRVGDTAVHEETVWAAGDTAADSAMPLLPAPHSRL